MERQLLMVSLILLSLLSCQNVQKDTQAVDDITTAETDTATPPPIVETKSETAPQPTEFDWDGPRELKNKLVSELQQGPPEMDKVIMDFLLEYGRIEGEFNKVLWDMPNRDSLNSLAYAPDGVVYKNALAFKRKVETNGLSIAQSEGHIYIAKNTKFIKSEIMDYLDSLSVEFIGLYCQEIDSICCDDAAIILSEETLVNRALHWGNMAEKAEGLAYEDIAGSQFNMYRLLIYSGQDNTPSFDWETNKFNENLMAQMNRVIANHPDSKAARGFIEYLGLLEQEDYMKTEKVSEYISKVME